MNRRDLVKFAALLPFFPKTNNQALNPLQFKGTPIPVQFKERTLLEQKYIQNVVSYNADPKHDQFLDEQFMGRIESIIHIPGKIHGLWQKDINNFRIQVGIALNDIAYNQKPADYSKQLMEAIEKASDHYHEDWDYGTTPWYEFRHRIEEMKFFIALSRNERFQCRTIKGLATETDLPESAIQQMVNKYLPTTIQQHGQFGYHYWEYKVYQKALGSPGFRIESY